METVIKNTLCKTFMNFFDQYNCPLGFVLVCLMAILTVAALLLRQRSILAKGCHWWVISFQLFPTEPALIPRCLGPAGSQLQPGRLLGLEYTGGNLTINLCCSHALTAVFLHSFPKLSCWCCRPCSSPWCSSTSHGPSFTSATITPSLSLWLGALGVESSSAV